MATLIYNAHIYLERGRFAEAILIADGLVKAVGTLEEVSAAAPADAERWDARGRTVVPGFNDSHQHLFNTGIALADVRLHTARSIADVKRITLEYIEKNRPTPGTVLHGMGWNHDYFTDEHRMLTRHDLDDITTDYPLVFERACGHVLTANTPALRLAGVTRDTVAPEGGAIDRDPDGEPNGIIRENARPQVRAILGKHDVDDTEKLLRIAMAHAAETGVTSVQTNDLRGGSWETVLEAYNRTQLNPTVRVYHQVNFPNPEDYRAFLERGYTTNRGTPFHRFGPLKLFVDGSLGARTALLRRPYADDPTTKGIATLTPEQIEAFVSTAVEYGCSVAIHAIGDGAVENVLNCYENYCPDGTNPLRLGIVHCQITNAEQIERFRRSDILALVQPIFLHYDMQICEDRVGPELTATSYAFGTMVKKGIHTSFGTDSPIEDMAPLDNLYCAVTRKNLRGEPEGGWLPGEKIDIYDAVDCYTLESAYASFEENVKGRLFPGYYADLVVLSEDIFTNPEVTLRTAKVDATMVGGRFVYEREGA